MIDGLVMKTVYISTASDNNVAPSSGDTKDSSYFGLEVLVALIRYNQINEQQYYLLCKVRPIFDLAGIKSSVNFAPKQICGYCGCINTIHLHIYLDFI